MYTKLILNEDFEINEYGDIVNVSNKYIDYLVSGKMVQIPLGIRGNTVIEKMKLYLLNEFRVRDTEHLCLDLDNIVFVEVNNNTRTSYLNIKGNMKMLFQQPVYFNHNYRVVPGHTNVAVSSNGVVVSTITGKILKQSVYDGYYYVYPDEGLRVHRLVALAWLYNSNPKDNHIVNHKDGNKLNCCSDNLEWVDYERNNLHAVENELAAATACLVKDSETGEIVKYPSLMAVSKFLKLDSNLTESKVITRKINNLFNGRYEIRLEHNDNRPWLSEMLTKEKIVNKPVQVMNLTTHNVTLYNSLKEAHRATGVNFNSIRSAHYANDERVIQNYIFRQPSDKHWRPNYQYNSKPIVVLATNVDTNESIEFKSVKAAARYFDCDKSKINLRIKNGSLLNNWKLMKGPS